MRHALSKMTGEGSDDKAKTIREMLVPGKRLDAGHACEVAALLLKNPRKTGQVVECLWDEEPGVANRAADALERASCRRPQILTHWKDALLDRMLDASENKLRWNLALMISRTSLTETESRRAAAVLRSWLDDKSSIVKTSAMHGLAGLTRWDPSMLPEVLDMLRIAQPERYTGHACAGAHSAEANGSGQGAAGNHGSVARGPQRCVEVRRPHEANHIAGAALRLSRAVIN